MDVESSIAPIGVNFQGLSIHFFAKSSLFSIGSTLSVPMKMDTATAELTRPSVARMCIEMDLLKKIPGRIWIGCGETGYWQKVTYEKVPKYCVKCYKQGHDSSECKDVGGKNEYRVEEQVQQKKEIQGEGVQQVWKQAGLNLELGDRNLFNNGKAVVEPYMIVGESSHRIEENDLRPDMAFEGNSVSRSYQEEGYLQRISDDHVEDASEDSSDAESNDSDLEIGDGDSKSVQLEDKEGRVKGGKVGVYFCLSARAAMTVARNSLLNRDELKEVLLRDKEYLDAQCRAMVIPETKISPDVLMRTQVDSGGDQTVVKKRGRKKKAGRKRKSAKADGPLKSQ